MSVMTDYQTKTDPLKVLFYNIDQLSQPCRLSQQESTSMADHAQDPAAANVPYNKVVGFSGSGIPNSTVMHYLVLISIHLELCLFE